MKTKLWIAGLLGLLLPGLVLAVNMRDLYRVELPASDQSAQTRADLMKAGLNEVIVRIVGDENIVQRDDVQALGGRASRFITGFRYVRTESADGSGMGQLMLRMEFDPDSLEGQLRQLQLPVWGAERPPVLVWLALEQGADRFMLGGGHGHPLVEQALLRAATRYGLPVQFPLYDLTDQQLVNFIDVWAGFNENLIQASARYGIRDILVLRLKETGSGWTARWVLLEEGVSREGAAEHLPLDETLAETLANVTQYMAGRYAIKPSESLKASSAIVVKNIDSLSDYAEVVRYLEKLPVVSAVTVVSVEPGQLVLDIEAKGNQQTLIRALENSLKLVPLPVSDKTDPEAPGEYRYIK